MRKWSVAAGIGLAITAVVIAFLPFDRPAPRGTYTYGTGFTESTNCAAPVVSAWRHEPPPSGWFGYAPLTDSALPIPSPCRAPARHRLLIAGFPAAGAVLLLVRRRRSTSAPDPLPRRADD